MNRPRDRRRRWVHVRQKPGAPRSRLFPNTSSNNPVSAVTGPTPTSGMVNGSGPHGSVIAEPDNNATARKRRSSLGRKSSGLVAVPFHLSSGETLHSLKCDNSLPRTTMAMHVSHCSVLRAYSFGVREQPKRERLWLQWAEWGSPSPLRDLKLTAHRGRMTSASATTSNLGTLNPEFDPSLESAGDW